MVLKGAFLHHFASNEDTTKRVRRRTGIIKNPGMKEVGQTVSDKARIHGRDTKANCTGLVQLRDF